MDTRRRPRTKEAQPPDRVDPEETVIALQATQLFAELPLDRLRGLARSARAASFVKGDTAAGVPWIPPDLVVVAGGAAHVCRVSVDGHELILRELCAGDVFGLVLLRQDADGGNMLRAASAKLQVYRLPAERVERALAEDARLCWRALQLVSQSVSVLCTQSESLAFEPMRVRLAHALAAVAHDHGGRLLVRHTQGELAAWIGSRQEEVSRALRQLAADGLIRVTPYRTGIEILDRAGLAAYS